VNASWVSQGDGSAEARSNSVSLADLNNDGLSDMVVAGHVNEGANDVGCTSVFINGGDSLFSGWQLPLAATQFLLVIWTAMGFPISPQRDTPTTAPVLWRSAKMVRH